MAGVFGGASRTLVFNLLGNDISASRAFDKVSRKVGETEAATSKFGKGMAVVGKTLVGIAGVAAVTAVATVKMASDFQQSMERIHTQAGVSQGALKGLGDGVLKLAGQVGTDPNNLADALYHIESSFASVGITSKKAMDLLRVGAEGAKIGGSDLVDTQNALDAAIASGIAGAQDYNQAMGALNATVGSGDMKMQDLADALGTGVLVIGKQFGVSLKDAGAALATFGDNNIRGAKAGTMLRMSIQSLAAPTKLGVGLLKDIGLSANQMALDMQKGGLKLALEDLKKHLDAAGISGVKTGAFLTNAFGKRAGAGVTVLIGQFDRFESKFPELNKMAGNFGAAWDAQTKTFKQNMDDLKFGVEALGIKIGTALMPYVQKAVEWLAKFVQQMIDGTGTGGRFARDMENIANAIRDIGNFCKNNQTLVKDLILTLALLWGVNKVNAFIGVLGKVTLAYKAIRTAMLEMGAAGGVSGGVAGKAGAAGKGAAAGGAAGAATKGGVLRSLGMAAFIASGADMAGKWLDGFNKRFAAGGKSTQDKSAWHQFVGAMSQTGAAALSFDLTKAGNKLDDALKIVGGWMVHQIAKGFAAAWGVVLRQVQNGVNLISPVINSGMSRVASIWSKSWLTVKHIAQDTWNGITVGARAVGGVWSVIWGAISDVVTRRWRQIVGAVKADLHIVATDVKDVMTGVRNTWNAIWGVIGGTVVARWNNIKSVTSTSLNWTRDRMHTVTTAISSSWNTAWASIKDFCSKRWGNIESVTSTSINWVRDRMRVVTTAISRSWDVAWASIKDFCSKRWDNIKSLTGSALGWVKNRVHTDTASTGSTWSKFMDGVHSKASSIMKRVQSVFSGSLTAIRGMFSSVTGQIGRIWGAIWRDVGSPIARLLKGPLTAFVHGINVIVGHIPGLHTLAAISFGGLAGLASGGPVPGRSPSKTADNILLRGTAGEHMVSVDEVAGFGGHGNLARLRKMARERKIQVPSGDFDPLAEGNPFGFAHGGAIRGYAQGGAIKNWPQVSAWITSHLGIPYLWGGNGPRYDCSSFTQHALAAGGISVPRTAAMQQYTQKGVSANALIAGDLGFVGRPAHHVEMYVGNGNWAQEAHTGTSSSISAQSLGGFTGGFAQPANQGGLGTYLGAAGGALGGFVRSMIGPLVAQLWKPVKAAINFGIDHTMPGGAMGYLRSTAKWPINAVGSWLSHGATSADNAANAANAGIGGGGNFVAGSGVQRWAPLVLKELAEVGQPASLLSTVLRRMNQESSGNPNAINRTDINAQRGDPSIGLMQVIRSTFNAYAGKYQPLGQYNPMANIYASMRYALGHYGSLSAAYNRSGGYALGTPWVPQDGPAYLHRGEAVIPARHNTGGGGAMHVHVHVNHPLGSPKEIAAVVVPALEAWRRNGGRSTRLAI